MICKSCNFENSPGNRFCGGCGKPLSTGSNESVPREIETERRFVTVMFCDLEGSTEMSSELDPEELLSVMRKYQAEASRVVDRYGGYIAQYLGDGILVYFGYPSAHENDVQRALESALDILDRIDDLNAEDLQHGHGLSLTARIGIHSGPVVAGEMGAGASRERLALGQTPNLAARLEGIASGKSVVVSKATRDMVGEGFRFESLGLKSFKGIPDDIEVFRVLRGEGGEHHLNLQTGPARTPLVGRGGELERLVQTFEAACAGQGAVLEIRADPGLGKSRLLQAFLDATRDLPHTAMYGRSTALESSTMFGGITDLLKRHFGFVDSDPNTTKLAAIEADLENLGIDKHQAVPALANLLSVSVDDSFEAPRLAGAELRAALLSTVASFLEAIAVRQPLLIVFEDLHWADSSTLELLDMLTELVLSHPIFCLITTRPTSQHEWSRDIHSIELKPLPVAEIESLVTQVCGGKKLPRAVMNLLTEKADGVPLYAEEVTKVVLESAAMVERSDRYELIGDAESIDIPTTLQGWLTARLDRLGPVREIAQVASVLGREFSIEMLSAITPGDPALVEDGLKVLVEAEIIHTTEDSSKYIFKHALIRDAANALLLRSTRRQLHGATARVLLEKYPEQAAHAPEQVAHHFEQAAEYQEAVKYWSMATGNAMRNGAIVEAVKHARAGLALIRHLAQADDPDRQEMVLQTLLAESLAATQGYVAPEVEAAYARAQELSEGIASSEDQFWILLGISFFHIVRGDLRSADKVSRQLIQIAANLQRSDLESYATNTLTCTQYFEGKFEPATTSLQRSMQLVSPDDELFRERTGSDIAVNHLYYNTLLLWHRGLYDESYAASEEALRLARSHSNDYSLCLALIFACVDAGYARRDFGEVIRASCEVIDLAKGRPFGVWGIQGEIFKVWAQLADPESRAGLSREKRLNLCQHLEKSLAMYRASGAGLKVPMMLAALAESLLHADSPDRAWTVVNEGINLAESGTDQVWLAELYRLKAACMQLRGEPWASCESELTKAVSIAEAQGSVALESRAKRSISEHDGLSI